MAKCKHCGKEFEAGEYMDTDFDDPRWSHAYYCFDCCFWLPKVEMKKNNDPTQVIVRGTHYHMCPETGHKGFGAGHGGAKFHIKFFDGRVATSSNLWCQGRIGDNWRHILTDNAEFFNPHNN